MQVGGDEVEERGDVGILCKSLREPLRDSACRTNEVSCVFWVNGHNKDVIAFLYLFVIVDIDKIRYPMRRN
jgi:hypothetical protein